MCKVFVFNVLLCLAIAGSFASPDHRGHSSHSHLSADVKFSNYVLAVGNTIEEHPRSSVECFQLYVPQLNNQSAVHEASYAKCLREAQDAYNAVDNDMRSKRLQLQEDSELICYTYRSCYYFSNTHEFFDCYIKTARFTAAVSFKLEYAASEAKKQLTSETDVIALEEQRCCEEAARIYVTETSKTYEALNHCLANS